LEPTQTKLLSAAAGLFAEHGYAGVSMRHIARSTGITQAAIYHHFASKEELYISAVKFLYGDNRDMLVEQAGLEGSAESRLAHLVTSLLEFFDQEADLRHIYFRERLEGDETRLGLLSKRVFPEIERAFRALMEELAPHMDSHLMVMSLAGLAFHHLEARKLSAEMDDGKPRHQQLPVLADHITSLLLNGVRKP
jgi:TetR/AcrR family transcriptional regulator